MINYLCYKPIYCETCLPLIYSELHFPLKHFYYCLSGLARRVAEPVFCHDIKLFTFNRKHYGPIHGKENENLCCGI